MTGQQQQQQRYLGMTALLQGHDLEEAAGIEGVTPAVLGHRLLSNPQYRALLRNRRSELRMVRELQLEAKAASAVTRLGELLENDDPQVSLAAARELLARVGTLPAPESLTTLEHEEHLLKVTRGPTVGGKKIWKRGQEAFIQDS